MTLTVNFISNPQGIVAGNALTQVRFWDKSLTTNGVVTSWVWKFAPTRAFTATSSPNILLATASSYFAVDDRVMLSNSGGALPTGLSASVVYWVKAATATYITISLTQGGAAVTYSDAGTGTHSIQQASDQQNPIIPYRNIAAGTYDVSLTCNDSGGTGATTATKTGYINAATLAFSKPTNAGLFGRITIFIYDSANATAINRVKTTNNNLFFQALKCSDTITKAGVTTFTVYNAGGATATEIGLLAADKNVAIISGRDVIWTGKISRAVQAKMSLYDTASPFMSWSVECDSDISKMRLQNVKAANQIAYNAPPGYIINKLVEPDAATDIDWRGAVNPSLISYEGANIQYTITSADMYTQFITLADLTGYDWRTRNDWVKYAYGASGYDSTAKTVTVSAITPYTTNSFAGKWLLFVNDVNADATTNNVGIKVYGLVASNTTTVITMSSITNATLAPASTNDVIILGNPVLDFSSDFRQPTYISTFTMNKARQSTLQNGYEMNDLSDFKQIITKVVAKGKRTDTGTTITSSFAAVTSWIDAQNRFTDTTYITYRTMGYVQATQDNVDASTSYVFLKGWNWALPSISSFSSVYIIAFIEPTTGGSAALGYQFKNPTEMILNGERVTKLTINAPVISTNAPNGATALYQYEDDPSTHWGMVLYVKSYTDIGWTTGAGSGQPDLKCGSDTIAPVPGNTTSAGTDAVFGPYILVYPPVGNNLPSPHYPGCIIWKTSSYSETSPASGSPAQMFGTIMKTITADSTAMYPDIEIYATNYLINHSFYYRKGTFWSFVYDWFRPDIRLAAELSENGWLRAGDEICILQNTGDTPTDTQYGQYKNQWQVVGWTLDADQMVVTVELGDHERNTNTLINDKTSGINYTIT